MDDDILGDESIEEEQQIVAERASEDERLESAGLLQAIGDLPVLRPPVTCERNTTIREATNIMLKEKIGYILVVELGRLTGIFTERDLLNKVVAEKVDIERVSVEDIMTPDPECLHMDYQLVYAINMMSIGGYRHIPVIDNRGRPINVVSARNIVDYFASLFPKDVVNIPPDPQHAIPPMAEGG